MLTHKKFDDPIKNIIYAVHDQLQLHTPDSCIIAGGYLRDHVLEREINDIDVYIDTREIRTANCSYEQLVDKILQYTIDGNKVMRLSNRISFHMVISGMTIQIKATNNNTYASSGTPATLHTPQNHSISGIVSVITKDVEITIAPGVTKDVTIQFIFVCHKPIDYINKFFSCNLSKIYYNGTKTVMLPDFVNGVLNKTLIFQYFNHTTVQQWESFTSKIKDKYYDFQVLMLNTPTKVLKI